jgi:hypothetical protein
VAVNPGYTPDQAVALLRAYGHLPPPAPGAMEAPITWDDLRALWPILIRLYRWAFGRDPETGGTLELLNSPRCSVPDPPWNEQAGTFLAARSCQWPHLGIRIARFDAPLPGLTSTDVAECWREAVDNWGVNCGIRPVWDDRQPNIVAAAVRIDGAGRTLADSYLPCGMTSTGVCRQRYDTGERWSRAMAVGVFTHELGHALGLEHDQAGTVMQPYFDGKVIRPTPRDVAQVQARYGKPALIPKPDPVPTGCSCPNCGAGLRITLA